MRGNPTPEMFDQIAAKFIVNLPKDELTDQRLGFHFEKAYFYYLDTLGLKAVYSKSDRPKQVVTFCNELLRVVSYMQLPKLSGTQISQLIQQNYTVVPVNGVIIMNMQETHVLMVQSRDNKKYGFPKGKTNQGQSCQTCAIREVRQQIGLKLQLDPRSFIDVQVQSKLYNKNYVKWCRFYVCKVEESCIVPRKCEYFQRTQGVRSIIHSATQICSIGWFKLGEETNNMINKDLMNTPSKLALFELQKKLSKNMYKEKKLSNPLDEFKGFDKNLGKIFQK